jgi:hypothetical protein
VVILLVIIVGYIGGYYWLLYEWLLITIILVAINGYFIAGY